MQLSSATEFNRYPRLFEEVARLVAAQRGRERCRVLSFGCSTGEEIDSLDRLYIEGCHLVGVDINPSVIERAKQSVPGTRNRVDFLTTRDFNSEQRFDVVLALSVLCRWPDARGRASITDLYSFGDFSGDAQSVADLVAVGGYLVVTNTNYFFEDTPVALESFAPVLHYAGCEGFVERFDVDGHRYINNRPGSCIFLKTGE